MFAGGEPFMPATAAMMPPPTAPLSSYAGPLPPETAEGEALNQRMMALVMKLTHPEKDRQSKQPLQLLEPSRTLYINNINEKIPTAKLSDDLKELFSEYGAVIDLVALKSFWRRGQAFVTLDSQEAATRALTELQGHVYGGKPIRVNYARKESRVLDKSRAEVKTEEAQAVTVKKPRGIVAREKALQDEFLALQQDLFNYQQSVATNMEDRSKRKAFSLSFAKSSEAKRVKTDEQDGHRTLFCDLLSEKLAEGDLISVYSSFEGFEKIRFIEAKRVAFIDFRSVESATAALNATAESTDFKVSFAKR